MSASGSLADVLYLVRQGRSATAANNHQSTPPQPNTQGLAAMRVLFLAWLNLHAENWAAGRTAMGAPFAATRPAVYPSSVLFRRRNACSENATVGMGRGSVHSGRHSILELSAEHFLRKSKLQTELLRDRHPGHQGLVDKSALRVALHPGPYLGLRWRRDLGEFRLRGRIRLSRPPPGGRHNRLRKPRLPPQLLRCWRSRITGMGRRTAVAVPVHPGAELGLRRPRHLGGLGLQRRVRVPGRRQTFACQSCSLRKPQLRAEFLRSACADLASLASGAAIGVRVHRGPDVGSSGKRHLGKPGVQRRFCVRSSLASLPARTVAILTWSRLCFSRNLAQRLKSG